MKKRIKSTDPRKPQIIRAFKRLSGAEKITNLVQTNKDTFEANAFRSVGNKKYVAIGTFTVVLDRFEVAGDEREVKEFTLRTHKQ